MNAAAKGRERTGSRRRIWFDTRFVIGLVLVLGSVAGVVAVVAASDSSIQVYTARTALTPGDEVEAGDFVETSVRLDAAASLYLLPGDVTDAGLVITKPVAKGELVPASAVGSTAGIRQTAIVIAVSNQLAASVVPGSAVDLWAAHEAEEGDFGGPVVLVPSAIVVRVIEGDGIVVGASAGSVEILVPRTRIARVLEATANGDSLSLVPVNLPAGR